MTAPKASSGGDYFLSYSRSDETFALRLANDLRAQGITLWVDQLDIRPSEHWDRAIERAVRDCRGILVVLSPRSVASDNVADEISFAIDSGKSVLPVMIERCSAPLRITRMQVIDATRDYQKALRQCVDELHRQNGQPPARPEAPAAEHRSLEAEALSAAKRELSGILGPIAAVLVDKAAATATSREQLYEILAVNIQDGMERERFLRSAKEPAAAAPTKKAHQTEEARALPASEVEAISKALTRYLGPLATVLTKRESAQCRSSDELKHRLSALIPTEQERRQFLGEVQCS